MSLDPAVLALIGTLCGGVGLKVAEHWLGRKRVKTDDATQIRDELRLEIQRQTEETKAAELERDQYRNQYYEVMDKLLTMQQQHTAEKQKIQDEYEAKVQQIRDEALRNVQRQHAQGGTSQPTPVLDSTETENA